MKTKIIYFKWWFIPNPFAEKQLNDFMREHSDHLTQAGILTQQDRAVIYYDDTPYEAKVKKSITDTLMGNLATHRQNRINQEISRRRTFNASMNERGGDQKQALEENGAAKFALKTLESVIHYTEEVLQEIEEGKFAI